ncbi:MAG: glycosyltransferase family 2 protein [Candidatus Sericytochromatia bacterium]
MDLIVAIVTFNSSDIIYNCLKSIVEKTKDLNYKIVIIDNNSNDNTTEIIKNSYPEIYIIENENNIGFGKANNKIFELFNSKYYFLLNPDTELLNNSIKILYDFMETHKDFACCGSNLYDENLRLQYSYGNFPTIKKALFEFGLHKIFKSYYQEKLSDCVTYKRDVFSEVPYVTGAALMIRSNIIHEFKGFDNDFFLYYEETELQYRIRSKGYKIGLVPDSKIKHISNYSINKMNNINRLIAIENGRFLFYKKVYGSYKANFIKKLYLFRYFLYFLFGKENLKFKDLIEIYKILILNTR